MSEIILRGRFKSDGTIFALQPSKNFQLVAACQHVEKFFVGELEASTCLK